MNANNKQTQSNYFDSVLYTRVLINEVKIIDPKKNKAQKYCAVNASILGTDDDGNKIYRTVDLIVRGQEAKNLLWSLRDRWPANRFKREGEMWIADINIGSPSHKPFEKKNGDAGASLSGRLINIRNLRIGDEDILGEITREVPTPVLVAPCYVNLVDVSKGIAKVAILDGKIGEHSSQNVNLAFDGIDAFNRLAEQGLCPKGFKHRDTNPKLFGIVEIENFHTEAFKNDEGDCKSCLKGKLANIRYLKANDKVIVSATTAAA